MYNEAMDTVAEILENYIRHLRNQTLSQTTAFCYFWGLHKDLFTISERSTELFMVHLSKEGYSTKSLNSKKSAVNNFLDYLSEKYNVSIHYISSNSTPKECTELRLLTEEEISKLRDLIKNDLRSLAIVYLLLYSGIKVGEVINLKMTDFLLTENKGSLVLKDRTIPLEDLSLKNLLKYLAVRPKSSEANLFVSASGIPLNIRNLRRQINRYFLKAEINNATLFDLRHTFCINKLKSGASIEEIATVAGHKNLITTQKYLTYINLDAN